MPIDRVIGIETEYGISRRSDITKRIYEKQKQIEDTVLLITSLFSTVNWQYSSEIDLPNVSNVKEIRNKVLENGARFYEDHGHPEYCTPECISPFQLIIHDKAGEKILNLSRISANRFLHETKESKNDGFVVYKNNVDSEGNSFGCHENYLMERRTHFSKIRDMLMPFLVTRQIFTGAGKVGIDNTSTYSISSYIYENSKKWLIADLEKFSEHFVNVELITEYDNAFNLIKSLLQEYEKRTKEKNDRATQIYQLSQRSDFFTCEEGANTMFDRPIINTRDEPHADFEKYRRLHIITGDSNIAPWSTFLKIGTTLLVLDLIEDGFIGNEVLIDNPVKTIKSISRDQEWKWDIKTKNGDNITAIDHQEIYLNKAKQHYSLHPMKNEIIEKWEYILDKLRRQDVLELSNKLDHVIKKRMIDAQMKKHEWELGSQNVRKLDLRYHNINPDEGLFYEFMRRGLIDTLGISENEISHAVHNPPENTRAYFRSKCITKFPNEIESINWDLIDFKINGTTKRIYLNEPLRGTKDLTLDFLESSNTALELLSKI